MSLHIVREFRSLNTKDFRVLEGIEQLMVSQSFPRVEELPNITGFNQNYIQKIIRKLHKMDLVRIHRNKNEYYEVVLKYNGFDALALKKLVESNILASIGKPIGVGKESEVYSALLDNGEECVIKIHRLGKTNFRATKRHRDYLARNPQLSRFDESRLAAEHEVKALKKLAGIIPVPQIFGYNRHFVVMERIWGDELQKYRHLDIKIYQDFFKKLLHYVQLALRSDIIHGDLSAYNVLVAPTNGDYDLFVIDWPQYVTTNHPNAEEKLLIDISNLYSFFGRRFPLEFNNLEKKVKEYLIESKKFI
ncbi:MAG: RIO1 family regulatory kinase/ATPase domain-containing protein [Candidatus Hodarchaeales archaeon]|jgi:RIO kinase 2